MSSWHAFFWYVLILIVPHHISAAWDDSSVYQGTVFLVFIWSSKAYEEMILSALLTSVGINLGLCFLFFTLYSILRKQPSNASVYAPRLLAEGKSQEGEFFNFERLLPSAGWARRAWQLSEDELLSISGFDAVVFVRIFIFRLSLYHCYLWYKYTVVTLLKISSVELSSARSILHAASY